MRKTIEYFVFVVLLSLFLSLCLHRLVIYAAISARASSPVGSGAAAVQGVQEKRIDLGSLSYEITTLSGCTDVNEASDFLLSNRVRAELIPVVLSEFSRRCLAHEKPAIQLIVAETPYGLKWQVGMFARVLSVGENGMAPRYVLTEQVIYNSAYRNEFVDLPIPIGVRFALIRDATILAVIVFLAWLVSSRWRYQVQEILQRRVRGDGRCPRCGYSLGSDTSICSECGKERHSHGDTATCKAQTFRGRGTDPGSSSAVPPSGGERERGTTDGSATVVDRRVAGPRPIDLGGTVKPALGLGRVT